MNIKHKTGVTARAKVFNVLLVLLITGTGVSTTAQTPDFKQIFSDAEYYLLLQDYREALPLYQKLYKIDSTNSNINYRLGQCYLNIPGLKNKAIPYLETAVNQINPKYNEGSYKETQSSPEAIFLLGQAYMIDHKLDKALEQFTKFKDSIDTKDIYNLDYVNQQIKACEVAKQLIAKPINIETKRFTPFADRNKNCNYPVLSGDRQTMVFTTKEKFYNAIYICTKKQDNWSSPVNITLDLVVEGDIYSTALNHDGTQLLLFKNEVSNGNIYYSNLVNGQWQPAKKLNGQISTKNWETFASFAPNDKHLLFTSNRKGGKGGLDIYIADKLANGSWGNIRNIEEVNTAHNEESPILSDNGEVLYFASQGHNTMGGFDIFFSKRLTNGTWSSPINIGYPINTPDDEFYYFPLDSTSALVPMVSPDLTSCYEIYTVEQKQPKKQKTIPPVAIAGKVVLSDNADINSDSITIYLKDEETSTLITSVQPSATGEYSITSKAGNYTVEVQSKFYSIKPTSIHIPENYSQSKFPLDLLLTSNIEAQGLALKLKNILFDFDSHELTRDAQFELEKVLSLMEGSPTLYVEVHGHTDSKGSPSYNLKLSAKRAKSVVEYLTQKGIDEQRFIVKGLGALSCIASNVNPDGSDNPTGRSLNRRASIRIFSGNKSIQIDNINVPENLKPQNLTYTILLAKPGDNFTDEAIAKIEEALDQFSNKTTIGRSAYVSIGSFDNKSMGIATLNKVVDINPNAMLVSEQELERLIKYEKQRTVSTQTVFTVLLMTSETSVPRSQFKGVLPIEEKGRDSIYRYYFGTFRSKEIAQQQLEKINVLGFPNAMIVKFK
ncbi:MAG: OmpA family protein [Bacteroidales bacterium]|nr:OmpA family protein [Bacteroidales bacterium]